MKTQFPSQPRAGVQLSVPSWSYSLEIQGGLL